MTDGVTGNTSDAESEEYWFESFSVNNFPRTAGFFVSAFLSNYLEITIFTLEMASGFTGIKICDMNIFLDQKKYQFLLLTLLTGFLFISCANNTAGSEHIYGFWSGLWHGMIAPVNFVISLFRDDFTLYAANNSGHGYALGFLIGSGGWGFFGGRGARKARQNRA